MGENAGESLLTDGLRAVDDLKRNNRSAFDVLTKVIFKFHDIGKDIHGAFDMQ